MYRRKLSVIMLVISFLICVQSGSVLADSWGDVSGHWARAYIERLAGLGVIKGYEDGTFRPDATITRAEFTAMLLRVLGNDSGQPETGNWYDRYLDEAREKGYILEGEFDSMEADITRGEMARMIARALEETYPSNIVDYAVQIGDYGNIPAEFRDHVLKVYVKGIVTGRPDGKFHHGDTATRAEASAMIVRLVDREKRIEPILKYDDKIVIDGQEVPVEEKQIIKPYYEVMERLSRIEGNVSVVHAGSIKEIIVYYTSQGEASVRNVTFVINFNIDEGLYGTQYLASIKKYDEKTYIAVKETLKVFYPTKYQFAYDKLINVINNKSTAGTGEMVLDGRTFTAKYMDLNGTTSIFIGGKK